MEAASPGSITVLHHLADVGGDLGDCEGARSCRAWSVGARVPRVNILLQTFPIIFLPRIANICCVCGNGVTAGAGRHNTANPWK